MLEKYKIYLQSILIDTTLYFFKQYSANYTFTTGSFSNCSKLHIFDFILKNACYYKLYFSAETTLPILQNTQRGTGKKEIINNNQNLNEFE